MSHLAISYDVIGHQQFGALPKHSATDLVYCVVHDIEEARSQGWASTFVTMDVGGAFDAVLYNRLLWRMQAQRWPDFILRWKTSFLHNRKVQVRYHGEAYYRDNVGVWRAPGFPDLAAILPALDGRAHAKRKF